MSEIDLKSPDVYINRELSWLEFNDRVLREGLSEEVPLLERLKFLSIVSSNLDEFFMIRVAGLMQQRAAGLRRRDAAGMTAAQQLEAIGERVHRMMSEQADGIRRTLAELATKGLNVVGRGEWTQTQRKFLQGYFTNELQPVLTPLAVEELTPCPSLPGLELNVAALVVPTGKAAEEARIVVAPVPRQFPRFVSIPGEGAIHLARLEDIIAANVGRMFEGCDVVSTAVFRITRDADVAIQGDEASDLLHAVEQAVSKRRRRSAVRLSLSAGADPRIGKWLRGWLELRPQEVYEVDGLIDATALMELATRGGFDDLKQPDWPPQPPRDLAGTEDIWTTVRDRDVMLFHPYESFGPVVALVESAAEDPGVLAIKQTLYRTSGDSPIIRALARAAESGKQVTVLVELKARFDEARNVTWARRLEDAGCHVIYGIAGYKTHAKALLVVRREAHGIRHYAHLSTGNYNDRTARIYSDIGLMTADRDLAGDVAALFNVLTGYSETVGWSRLTIAPTDLRRRLVELIEREADASTREQPGLIMAKVNSLEDPEICRALYRASQAGVRVRLNVRGICCLRPGVKKVSENIEVRSIVDRFLEHARVFYFGGGGHEEFYLSSADLMGRNLDKRLETLFPVARPELRRRLMSVLQACFADNQKARRLLADGTWERVAAGDEAPVRAQQRFYEEALSAARVAEASGVRFQPLSRPKE